MAEIPRNDQHPRRTLIIAENISAPADQRVWSIATALWQAHYEVSIICPKRRSAEASEETIEGIHVFRHPVPFQAHTFLGKLFGLPLSLVFNFVLSIKIARRIGFDVVHICNPPNIIFLIGAIYKTFAKKSFLFDYRDANPKQSKDRPDSLGSLAERLAFKTADLSLFLNESQRKIAIGRSVIPAEKAIVLRPCPNLDRVTPKRPDLLWKNGRAQMVAYAGEVSKAEGLDLFANSIEYIVHECQRADIQFVIVGGGPEWSEIARIYGKMDLNEYATFSGWVDDETLFTILSTADLCVDPRPVTSASLNTTSEKIMEYMAIGKPIVQFDTAEGRLVAREASRYVPENDSVAFGKQILEIIDKAKMLKLMGDAGQQRIRKELSWQREQQKLLLAYDALFAMRAQRSARGKRQKQKAKKPHASKPG